MRDAGLPSADVDEQLLLDLTSFQRDLLFVVAGRGAASGQELKAELEEATGETVLPGQLYPNLDELQRNGLVRKEVRDGRTNDYSATERGRGVLSALVRWQCERVDPALAEADWPASDGPTSDRPN
ncbi:PadR family transcriptional regulator [Halobacterium yunchengense]|uniref:PadR family transcriptional regulator n=1 Tax=Halobacterium yunchengense TaxID=3108497 RepID=UPI003AB1B6F1